MRVFLTQHKVSKFQFERFVSQSGISTLKVSQKERERKRERERERTDCDSEVMGIGAKA